VAADPLHDLVARSQQKDTQAFSQLMAHTQTGVFNLAYRILGNREEAEDLTQEVFLRVWRVLPDFRGDSKFTTWLYRVTSNACLNRRRQLRSHLYQVDSEQTLNRMPSLGPGPAELARESDRRHCIWSAVDKLPPKYAVVITLFYQEQLSYQEIAEVLSLPLGTVKAHLNRARKALAKALAPPGREHHAEL